MFDMKQLCKYIQNKLFVKRIQNYIYVLNFDKTVYSTLKKHTISITLSMVEPLIIIESKMGHCFEWRQVQMIHKK